MSTSTLSVITDIGETFYRSYYIVFFEKPNIPLCLNQFKTLIRLVERNKLDTPNTNTLPLAFLAWNRHLSQRWRG